VRRENFRRGLPKAGVRQPVAASMNRSRSAHRQNPRCLEKSQYDRFADVDREREGSTRSQGAARFPAVCRRQRLATSRQSSGSEREFDRISSLLKLRRKFVRRHLAVPGDTTQTPRMPKTSLIRALLAALVAIIPFQTQSQATSAPTRRAIAGPADMIVVNGRVYTVDDSRPMVSAFAVKNGRILFAGSEREVERWPARRRGYGCRRCDCHPGNG
jgi:Predicted metal-dependent hydrolase with the TIM-barrel fold